MAYQLSPELLQRIQEAHNHSSLSDAKRRAVMEDIAAGRTAFTDSAYRKSKQHRQKISDARKGMECTEETREKMREAKLGVKRKPFSDEHKAKISQALRDRHARNRAKKSQ